jgi:hypothetical protein
MMVASGASASFSRPGTGGDRGSAPVSPVVAAVLASVDAV